MGAGTVGSGDRVVLDMEQIRGGYSAARARDSYNLEVHHTSTILVEPWRHIHGSRRLCRISCRSVVFWTRGDSKDTTGTAVCLK